MEIVLFFSEFAWLVGFFKILLNNERIVIINKNL